MEVKVEIISIHKKNRNHTFDRTKHTPSPNLPSHCKLCTPPEPVSVCKTLPSCNDHILTTPVVPLNDPAK